MIFNYIRVSTTDQNTERQLLDIPCDRAYIEKISGKNTDRPELQAMLLNIRSGDILNIHEMSRLARNTRDLLNLVEEITAKGATIIFHKENLTFKGDGKQDPYQKMMMTMLGAVAELEKLEYPTPTRIAQDKNQEVKGSVFTHTGVPHKKK